MFYGSENEDIVDARQCFWRYEPRSVAKYEGQQMNTKAMEVPKSIVIHPLSKPGAPAGLWGSCRLTERKVSLTRN